MSHDLSYNQVTLIFRENEIEKKYQHKLKMENIRAYKYANINSIILFVISASLLFPTADEFTTTMIAYFLIAYSFLLSIILLLTFMSNPFKLFDRYKRLVFNF